MEEIKMKMIWALLLLASSYCFFCQLYASPDVSFNETLGGRWIMSEKEEYSSAAGLLKLFPTKHNTSVEDLIARDRLRHGRILKSSTTAPAGEINFTLKGSFDPNLVGMYYSKVKLGSPPREYNMLIDTGSDLSWVSCSSCTNCPRTSGLGLEMNFYDTGNSSTANVISCSDRVCTSDECNKENQCSYTLDYADQSSTNGFYVSDVLHLDTILRTSSPPIIFGCSISRSGGLGLADRAVDGILGFGRRDISIISQLSSRGIAPKAFSHCLKGEGGSGGILVLGEILHPRMVYSPLVPSKGHYNVYLQSVAVQGRILRIDSAAFANSGDRGTIIDSGTTLVHLVEEAYEVVVSDITTTVSHSAKSIISDTYPCYLISSSSSNNITKMFPQIYLNFAGGASMDLRPADYLTYMGFFEGAAKWCILFVTKNPSLTIIGDVALKDRIVVYDLARQRVGWADYNCSLPMNVSISSGTDEVAHPGALYHIIELVFIFYLFWSH